MTVPSPKINQKLYAPLNVLRNWSADYRECSPEYYVSRKPIKGFAPIREQLYGFGRPNEKLSGPSLRTLVVPGATQTNTITVSTDTGGQVTNWTYKSVDGDPKELINLWGGQGRGYQPTVVWFENYPAVNIVAITRGTVTMITVENDHQFEPGKLVRVILGSIFSADLTPALTAGTFVARAALAGANYRRMYQLDVDTSGDSGRYDPSGTLVVSTIHNPTTGGSAVGANPIGNSAPPFDNVAVPVETADHVYNQGSPCLECKMHIVSGTTNQGYIETTCIPMDFNPSGETSAAQGIEHGGNKYAPVLWHGIRIKRQLWINFEGNEGVHKSVVTTIWDAPLLVGYGLEGYNFVSLNSDAHLTYNLGLESRDPKAKAVTIDDEGDPVVFGGDYLENVDWPNGTGGKYWSAVGPGTETGFTLVLLPGYCVRFTDGVSVGGSETNDSTDNPWNDNGTGKAGGALCVVSSDETTVAGVWNVTESGGTLASASVHAIDALGYGTDSFGTTQLGVAHHIDSDDTQVIPAGNRETTTWFVTGESDTVFDEDVDGVLTFFANMLDRGYL